MILLKDRQRYELLFGEYCQKNNVLNCPMNFIAWMQSEPEGKELVRRLKDKMILFPKRKLGDTLPKDFCQLN